MNLRKNLGQRKDVINIVTSEALLEMGRYTTLELVFVPGFYIGTY
jgi:hypothetical protein